MPRARAGSDLAARAAADLATALATLPSMTETERYERFHALRPTALEREVAERRRTTNAIVVPVPMGHVAHAAKDVTKVLGPYDPRMRELGVNRDEWSRIANTVVAPYLAPRPPLVAMAQDHPCLCCLAAVPCLPVAYVGLVCFSVVLPMVLCGCLPDTYFCPCQDQLIQPQEERLKRILRSEELRSRLQAAFPDATVSIESAPEITDVGYVYQALEPNNFPSRMVDAGSRPSSAKPAFSGRITCCASRRLLSAFIVISSPQLSRAQDPIAWLLSDVTGSTLAGAPDVQTGFSRDGHGVPVARTAVMEAEPLLMDAGAGATPRADARARLAPESLAELLRKEGIVSEAEREALVKAGIDSSTAKYLTAEALQEAGISSALTRAKLLAWIAERGD